MCTPAMRSARSVAASIALMVSSRSVTTPLRIPVEGASPTPMISRPSGPLAATTAHVFVVPISSPAMVSCFNLRPPPRYWARVPDILLYRTRNPAYRRLGQAVDPNDPDGGGQHLIRGRQPGDAPDDVHALDDVAERRVTGL